MILMMRLCGAVAAAMLFGAAASAATLLIDQQNTGGIVAIGTGQTVQSFTPDAENIAGVDVWIGGSAVLSADVTAAVYEGFDAATGALDGLLATETIAAFPREATARFRFEPVALAPTRTYYLEFLTGSLGVGITFDTYAGGAALLPVDPFGRSWDVAFTTFYDPGSGSTVVPVPAAGGLLAAALGLMGMLTRRRRDA